MTGNPRGEGPSGESPPKGLESNGSRTGIAAIIGFRGSERNSAGARSKKDFGGKDRGVSGRPNNCVSGRERRVVRLSTSDAFWRSSDGGMRSYVRERSSDVRERRRSDEGKRSDGGGKDSVNVPNSRVHRD